MKIKHFEKMRSIGKYASHCLLDLQEDEWIVPGRSTEAIDLMVRKYAEKHGIFLAQYLYEVDHRIFPSACCVSINEEICHGLPSPTRILKDGDIVKVDVTFKDVEGWHGDTCWTYPVGKVATHAQDLINVTWEALYAGIESVKIGNTIGNIGLTIESYIKGTGFSIVKDYCGHSIGKKFHMAPQIPHYYDPNLKDSIIPFKSGMMFTIEPMINVGKSDALLMEDGWTVKTKDGSLSAQFEHTIGIDEDGSVIIFTEL